MGVCKDITAIDVIFQFAVLQENGNRKAFVAKNI